MSDVSLIERHIAERFARWEIRLPQEAVARREPGHIFKRGWHIGFLWGEEEGEEYLEYLSQHRMTDDLHTRVYACGRVDDDLPAPSMLSGPEETRAIYAELRKAGLLPPLGMNQGALEINEFLRSQGEPPP
jgi:hypothetical protein